VQRLPLSLAAPGMKLAREVATPEGKVLCGPGLELTEDLITRLERSGIGVVTVEGHPVRLPGELSISQRLKELEARFSKVKDDPVLRALMRLIGEYWVEQERR